MSRAPAMPTITPATPLPDSLSPMNRAAQTIVATGVSVAMSEK